MRVLGKSYICCLRTCELVFHHIWLFDGQNLIIRSLLSKREIEKRTDGFIEKLLNDVPSVADIKIKSNLKKLRIFDENLLGRDNDSDNDNDDDSNDNADDNDNNNGAAAPLGLSDLLDIPKQALAKMVKVKNKKPEIKNMEKVWEGLPRDKKLELNGELNKIFQEASQILSDKKSWRVKRTTNNCWSRTLD